MLMQVKQKAVKAALAPVEATGTPSEGPVFLFFTVVTVVSH